MEMTEILNQLPSGTTVKRGDNGILVYTLPNGGTFKINSTNQTFPTKDDWAVFYQAKHSNATTPSNSNGNITPVNQQAELPYRNERSGPPEQEPSPVSFDSFREAPVASNIMGGLINTALGPGSLIPQAVAAIVNIAQGKPVVTALSNSPLAGIANRAPGVGTFDSPLYARQLQADNTYGPSPIQRAVGGVDTWNNYANTIKDIIANDILSNDVLKDNVLNGNASNIIGYDPKGGIFGGTSGGRYTPGSNITESILANAITDSILSNSFNPTVDYNEFGVRAAEPVVPVNNDGGWSGYDFGGYTSDAYAGGGIDWSGRSNDRDSNSGNGGGTNADRDGYAGGGRA